ncbi:hypothetical protein [Lonepinella sp. BR2474]|uniref:hypothetical protein n=1 Tax=unclassified Lonepinella TaxID=2642006 RepID=UPI003F6DB3D1
MLKSKIKLGFLLSCLFISPNVWSYGCNDFSRSSNEYCTPDGSRLYYYDEVTKEMKKIKSTFRGKTYTYKDLIQPLNPDELVGYKEFSRDLDSFNLELERKLNNLTEAQFMQVLQIRGDYLEKILDNKYYDLGIVYSLMGIDKMIISLFDKFKVSPENQKLFKTGSAEKHKTLEIMSNYIKLVTY